MKQRVLFGLVDQFRKDRLDTRVRDSCYRESRHCRMPLRDFCQRERMHRRCCDPANDHWPRSSVYVLLVRVSGAGEML